MNGRHAKLDVIVPARVAKLTKYVGAKFICGSPPCQCIIDEMKNESRSIIIIIIIMLVY